MTLQTQEVTQSIEDTLISRLKRFGVTEWHEVLLCSPTHHEDYSLISTLRQAIDTGGLDRTVKHLFALVVTTPPTAITSPKKRVSLSATDGRLTVKIVVFYSDQVEAIPWLSLRVGQRIVIKAPLQIWGSSLQIVYPQFVDEKLIGKTVPIYEKRRGILADGVLFDATRFAIENYLRQSTEYLIEQFPGYGEDAILKAANLTDYSFQQILLAAHSPNTIEQGSKGIAAMRKLAALSIVLNAKRMKSTVSVPESRLPITERHLREAIKKIPFVLTQDQLKAIEEIIIDLASPFPMRRLVTGDVGNGKTVCIFVPAYLAQTVGKWVVVLSPNAYLVKQFILGFEKIFPNIPIHAVSAADTEELPDKPTILVGTTALLKRVAKAGISPAFICVDEQQKFSVRQRVAMLSGSGNYLEATATPIPRTTALITHGAMDISTLRECPVQKRIQTFIVNPGDAQRMFNHTQKIIASGAKVAVIYPLVNDTEHEKKSVVSAFGMWEALFPGKAVMIHGQMSEKDKIGAIQDLKEGKKQIAIATSILEVGSDIEGLRSLIVVNADLYGVASLHQLRGRVAREGGNGYFFLYLPDTVKPETLERLNLLVEHDDGLALADMDAQLRGYGDLFELSEKQSGVTQSLAFRCVQLTPADLELSKSISERLQ